MFFQLLWTPDTCIWRSGRILFLYLVGLNLILLIKLRPLRETVAIIRELPKTYCLFTILDTSEHKVTRVLRKTNAREICTVLRLHVRKISRTVSRCKRSHSVHRRLNFGDWWCRFSSNRNLNPEKSHKSGFKRFTIFFQSCQPEVSETYCKFYRHFVKLSRQMPRKNCRSIINAKLCPAFLIIFPFQPSPEHALSAIGYIPRCCAIYMPVTSVNHIYQTHC